MNVRSESKSTRLKHALLPFGVRRISKGFASAAGPFCSLINCWLLAYQFTVNVGSLLDILGTFWRLLGDLGDLLETLGTFLRLWGTFWVLLGTFWRLLRIC